MAFGRFERTQGEAPLSDINMTPLIDVMLVLLVILLLTAPLLDGRIALDLPRVAASPAPAAPGALLLELQRDGRMVLDGRPVSAAALPALLHARAAADARAELRIRADSAVPYGDVARVMAAAQAAGLSRVGLLTQPPGSPAAGPR
ncbi:MAG: biopolymer transporter ExbD [Betaproteobacteria bacterium]|uniref:ExbD/TolR family protein n=1 Tax=Thiomonas sp. FB-6 TaxID=1158291 RepID=UPI000374A06C|nr:biopolymer transporter ExbD [Thiomonas sp. FB-6]MDE2152541.1 biopolymer transporter ExbD [Betaproteobacteria bacterium]